jgi:hypothetical protein
VPTAHAINRRHHTIPNADVSRDIPTCQNWRRDAIPCVLTAAKDIACFGRRRNAFAPHTPQRQSGDTYIDHETQPLPIRLQVSCRLWRARNTNQHKDQAIADEAAGEDVDDKGSQCTDAGRRAVFEACPSLEESSAIIFVRVSSVKTAKNSNLALLS